MKTRIQSIVWALFWGLSFGLLMNSCQKEAFLDLEPNVPVTPLDRQAGIPEATDELEQPHPFASSLQTEALGGASASDAVLPIVLRINCRIVTILYKPNEKVQVYKCKGEDLHTQSPVEIKGKRSKNYLTGAFENKGVVTYPNGAFRMDQVSKDENGNLQFNLTGISGTMTGGSGSAVWKDPKTWLAGNSMFEGTLQY